METLGLRQHCFSAIFDSAGYLFDDLPEVLNELCHVEYGQDDGVILPFCSMHESAETKMGAIVTGKLIAIVTIDSKSIGNIIAELEFSDSIVSGDWSPCGQCFVAADCKGLLHFVTREGSLILSHRILSSETILAIKLSSRGDPALPCLQCVSSNGMLIYVDAVPISGLIKMALTQPESLSMAVQKMKLMTFQLSTKGLLTKCVLFPAIAETSAEISRTGFLCIAGIDRHNRLSIYHLDPFATSPVPVVGQEIAMPNGHPPSSRNSNDMFIPCKDLAMLPHESRRLLLCTFSNGRIACFDVTFSRSTLTVFSASLQGDEVLTDISFTETVFVSAKEGSCSPGCCPTLNGSNRNFAVLFALCTRENNKLESPRDGDTPLTVKCSLFCAVVSGSHGELFKLPTSLQASPCSSPSSLILTKSLDNDQSSTTAIVSTVATSLKSVVSFLLEGMSRWQVTKGNSWAVLDDFGEHETEKQSSFEFSKEGFAAKWVGVAMACKLSQHESSISPLERDKENALRLLSNGIDALRGELLPAGELLAMFCALISIPHWSSEFIDRAARIVQGSLTSIQEMTCSTAPKQFRRRIQLDETRVLKCLHLAKQFWQIVEESSIEDEVDSLPVNCGDDETLIISSSETQPSEGETSQERIRWLFCSLLFPRTVRMLYDELVARGLLGDALVLSNSFLGNEIDRRQEHLWEQLISLDKDRRFLDGELVDWVDSDVLTSTASSDFKRFTEFLRISECFPVVADPILDRRATVVINARSMRSNNQALFQLSVALEMANRAIACERTDGHPLTALQLSSFAYRLACVATGISPKKVFLIESDNGIVNVEGKDNVDSTEIVFNCISRLHHAIQLQNEIYLVWKTHVMLREICNLGFQDIVFSKLFEIKPECFQSSVVTLICPLLLYFSGSQSEFLMQWMEYAVDSRLILPTPGLNTSTSSHVPSEDFCEIQPMNKSFENSESNSCYLSTLVAAVDLITEGSIRAKALLLLLQVPAVDEELIAFSDTAPSWYDTPVAKLCRFAASLSPEVDMSTKEALAEAVRLVRIKGLAFSYGICGLDPRDLNQVRSAAVLMSSSFTNPRSVQDAVELVSSWSTSNFHVSSLLTRAVVYRATEEIDSMETDEEAVRKKLLLAALAAIPERLVSRVVEDSCSTLISLVDAKVESLLTEKDAEVVKTLKMSICREVFCAIAIASWYLDQLRGGEGNQEGGDEFPKPSMNSSSRVCLRSEFVTSSLRNDLKRLQRVHKEFDQYISLHSLQSNSFCQDLIVKAAAKRAETLLERGRRTDPTRDEFDASSSAFSAELRVYCQILGVSLVFFANSLIKQLLKMNEMDLAMTVTAELHDFGQFASVKPLTGPDLELMEQNYADKESDAALLLDMASVICANSARQAFVKAQTEVGVGVEIQERTIMRIFYSFGLSRCLLQEASISCPIALMGQAVDMIAITDMALHVFSRVEGATADPSTGARGSEGIIRHCHFSRDGILMKASSIVLLLMKFSMKELQRRQRLFQDSESPVEITSIDIDEAIVALQRSENHLLASRMILSSWYHSTQKSQAQRSSILALSRKILGYREIDTQFATAALTMLPFDIMIKEVKSAVPSIQSDFSRLRTVASIGEELSQLCEQEALLSIFQDLRTNSRWWHILASYGVSIDPRAFQGTDRSQKEVLLRQIVGHLLEKSSLDLSQAIEFCSQFHLEPEVAVVDYVEKLLLRGPTTASDGSWMSSIRKAVIGIQDKAIVRTLRGLLTSLHPLDYEKIRFVCSWLIDSLSEEIQTITRENSGQIDADSLVAEVGLYRRYVEMCSFLSSFVFPHDVLPKQTNLESVFCGVSGVYEGRIPLWQLLEDPFGVMEPLLLALPDVAVKLAPLCQYVNIDLEDFFSRHVMCAYSRCSNIELTADKAIRLVQDLMRTLSEWRQKVEIWKWVFEKELTRNEDLAARSLIHALEILESHSGNAAADTSGIETFEDVGSELLSDLVKLCCKKSLSKLAEFDDTFNFTSTTMLSQISTPPEMLESLLEASICHAWQLEISELQPLTISDLYFARKTCQVDRFLARAADVLAEVATYCSCLEGKQNILKVVDPTTLTLVNICDDNDFSNGNIASVRQVLLGKLLADIDPALASSATGTAPSDAGLTGVRSRSSCWSQQSSSPLSLSEGEIRRREDIYFSFCISCLVASCKSSKEKVNYHNQLIAVLKGRGVRSMRRLSCRSKFRAAQALIFGNSDELNFQTEDSDLRNRWMLSFCQAELQETRILCSESLLHSALGLSASTDDRLESSEEADPDSLIRTWLHDEGSRIDAVELARDVLLASGTKDSRIWETLLRHMVQQQQERPLLQTVLALRHMKGLQTIGSIRCLDALTGINDLGVDLMKAIMSFGFELASRTQQVLDLMAATTDQQGPKVVATNTIKNSPRDLSILSTSTYGIVPADSASTNTKRVSAIFDSNQFALVTFRGVNNSRISALFKEYPLEELILCWNQAKALWSSVSKHISMAARDVLCNNSHGNIAELAQRLVFLLVPGATIESSENDVMKERLREASEGFFCSVLASLDGNTSPDGPSVVGAAVKSLFGGAKTVATRAYASQTAWRLLRACPAFCHRHSWRILLKGKEFELPELLAHFVEKSVDDWGESNVSHRVRSLFYQALLERANSRELSIGPVVALLSMDLKKRLLRNLEDRSTVELLNRLKSEF